MLKFCQFWHGTFTSLLSIKKLLKISREYVDKSYHANKDSMSEIERVI